MRLALFRLVPACLVLALTVAVVPACGPKPEPYVPDAGHPSCATACTHATQVCGVDPTLEAGAGGCTPVCENAQQNAVDFKTTCINTAKTCAAVKTCLGTLGK